MYLLLFYMHTTPTACVLRITKGYFFYRNTFLFTKYAGKDKIIYKGKTEKYCSSTGSGIFMKNCLCSEKHFQNILPPSWPIFLVNNCSRWINVIPNEPECIKKKKKHKKSNKKSGGYFGNLFRHGSKKERKKNMILPLTCRYSRK